MKSQIKCVAFAGSLLVLANFVACGKKGDSEKSGDDGQKIKVDVTAGGLSVASDTALTLANKALGLLGPEDETGGYPGIGVNYGESVVDGLKIKLSGMTMSGIPGSSNAGPTLSVFDWSASPQEVSIESGLNKKLEVTADIEAKEFAYRTLTINMKNTYKVKAWAYLDSDNNGTIDTTIYTTAAEVKKVSQKLTKAEMTDYDFYEYKFAMIGAAPTLDDSANDLGFTTFFPHPVDIKATGEVTTVGTDGVTKVTKQASLTVDLAIDTFQIVKVWDGRFGTGSDFRAGDPTSIPYPVYPFPYSATDSRKLYGTMKSVDFFPEGKPAFGLGDYIPMYAFPNVTGIKAMVFVVSKAAAITPFNSQVLTIITDDQGKPLIGKASLGERDETLHIGAAARMFEKQSDGKYKFATSYGMTDANGNMDGGLYYNNDITMAGHHFEGLDLSLAVGGEGTMTMTDGPRCKSEYDYCVGAAGKTAYYQRVR